LTRLGREGSGPGAVVIVGAGPAGLTAAYELAKRGATSTVFETRHVVRAHRKAARREATLATGIRPSASFPETFGALDQMSHLRTSVRICTEPSTYRLEPTVKRASTQAIDALPCELYNAALQESMTMSKARQSAPRRSLQVRPVQDPDRSRELQPSSGPSVSRVCRAHSHVSTRLSGVLSQGQAGQAAPGYPRFKSASRWDSLSWCYLNVEVRRGGLVAVYIQGSAM